MNFFLLQTYSSVLSLCRVSCDDGRFRQIRLEQFFQPHFANFLAAVASRTVQQHITEASDSM